MYMTIRHYRVPPSKMEEVVRRVDEVWLDRLSKLEGFESYFVTQPDDSHLTSVSVFIEEEAGRKAAEASAEWVGSHLSDLDVEFLEMWQGTAGVHGGEEAQPFPGASPPLGLCNRTVRLDHPDPAAVRGPR